MAHLVHQELHLSSLPTPTSHFRINPISSAKAEHLMPLLPPKTQWIQQLLNSHRQFLPESLRMNQLQKRITFWWKSLSSAKHSINSKYRNWKAWQPVNTRKIKRLKMNGRNSRCRAMTWRKWRGTMLSLNSVWERKRCTSKTTLPKSSTT